MSLAIPDPDCPPMISSTPPQVPPTAAVIFGATGDLTHRKIVPAFYHLAKNNLLPEGFAIIGFARRPKSDDEFRKDLGEALHKFSHTKPVDEAVWKKLAAHIYYFQGELDDPAAYKKLAEKLKQPAREQGDQRQLPLLSRHRAGILRPRRAEPRRRRPRQPGRTAPSAASSSRSRSAPTSKAPRNSTRTLQSVLRRARHLPHRPLPRQGDGAEPDLLPLRQLDLRAALEPPLHRPRADHRGRAGRRRVPRRLLRPRRRRARHDAEPHVPALHPHRDGSRPPRSTPNRSATRR